MAGFLAQVRSGVAALAITATLAFSAQSYAATGSVRLHITRAGFIVGIGGGSGQLHLHGKTYRIKVGGVGVGTIGASAADLVGHAYNLQSPADIAGTYSAIGAGVAIAGGARSVRLQNSKGVVLELQGKQVGLEASLNLNGIEISLQ